MSTYLYRYPPVHTTIVFVSAGMYTAKSTVEPATKQTTRYHPANIPGSLSEGDSLANLAQTAGMIARIVNVEGEGGAQKIGQEGN